MQCPLGGFTAGDYPINHADSMCVANYYNATSAAMDAASIWNIVYSKDPTLIASGLSYLDGRFRGDASQGSLSYFAGVSAPPFTNVRGQWYLWAQLCAEYTSNISGKRIQLTAYEGGFNAISNYSVAGNPYTPPSTGVPVTITSADVVKAMFAYSQSQKYADFLTDATNGFLAAGAIFPSQYCVVNGGWSQNNPFNLIQPNIDATPPPSYAAWRALNGK